MALSAASDASVGLINPANDGNTQTGGIAKFTSRKATYPYVEMYLGLVGSGTNIQWLANANSRTSFIAQLIQRLQTYPEISGVYVDFEGVTSNANYAAFMSSLKRETDNAMLKLITALPHGAGATINVYYNPTLRTLPFNVLKTYEDMHATSMATHPLSPLTPTTNYSTTNYSTTNYSTANNDSCNNYNHDTNNNYNYTDNNYDTYNNYNDYDTDHNNNYDTNYNYDTDNNYNDYDTYYNYNYTDNNYNYDTNNNYIYDYDLNNNYNHSDNDSCPCLWCNLWCFSKKRIR
uniref:GH18 domain-containing protein n=1 Tax=Anopheles atroparvus TaxID=41427 RepID=A0A182J1R9_ANOAO